MFTMPAGVLFCDCGVFSFRCSRAQTMQTMPLQQFSTNRRRSAVVSAPKDAAFFHCLEKSDCHFKAIPICFSAFWCGWDSSTLANLRNRPKAALQEHDYFFKNENSPLFTYVSVQISPAL